MSDGILLSVIIPVFNAEKTIRICLESIENQIIDKNKFEVVIVNDGSMDGSLDIIKSYESCFPHFKLVNKKNEGVSAARRDGIYASCGEYIVSVDADDRIKETFLNNIYNAIIESNADIITWGFTEITDTGREVKHEVLYPSGIYNENDYECIRDKYLYDKEKKGINAGSLFYAMWTKAIKKEPCKRAVDQIGLDLVIGEDLFITLYALKYCRSIHIIDETGYLYCNYSDSIMRKLDKKSYNQYLILIHKLYDYFKTIEEKERNPFYVYVMYSTYNMLHDTYNKASKHFNGIETVTYLVDEITHLCIKNAFVARPLARDRIKIFLMKQSLWRMLFFFFRFLK